MTGSAAALVLRSGHAEEVAMKIQTFIVGVSAAVLCAVLASPTSAQGKGAEAEIAELRAQVMELQDANIDLARRFNEEKRRLQVELERLLIERAEAERAAAAAPQPRRGGAREEQALSFEFNATPLAEVVAYLEETSGKKVTSKRPVEGVTVTLRVRELPLSKALELISANAHEGDAWAELTIKERSGGIRVE
jgi:hypothetical protein